MKKGLMILGSVTMLVMGIWLESWGELSEKNEIAEEELLFMEIPVVITAARKEQKLTETAAAAYVITQEDIRRSGATTIPELLRMVPGLHVAQIDANKWAVASRGFNGRWSNELLLLVDGRSVYTPLFSGVRWNMQDTLLEDVERIEVIRGPGGTLWGANAVNGVINIISKHAADTQGGLVHGGTGDQERGFGAFRYGGKVGEDAYFRAYVKYFDRNDFETARGDNAHDQWKAARGGFRLDWDLSYRDSLSVQGDIYDGDADQKLVTSSLSPPSTRPLDDTADLSGGNLLIRWKRGISEASDWILQAYFDRADRDDSNLRERIDTYDLDFQHRFPLGERQEVTWGLGYRLVSDNLKNSFTVSFDPENERTDLFSAFLQDEIGLSDNLRLTLGSKFEHNDFSGFEYQPSARLLWLAAKRHTLWGGVSRAVHPPSRSESDIRINFVRGEFPTVLSILGNSASDSEELLVYEIGYRSEAARNLSLYVTAFYNVYENLSTTELELGISGSELDPQPPHLLVPTRFANKMDGETYGIEVTADWQATRNWRLKSSYSYLKINLHLNSGSVDTVTEHELEGNSPRHQFQIRSYLALPYNVEFDTALHYVDNLPSLGIPSYTRLDARLGWRPTSNLEFSLSLQNLLDNRYPEFAAFDIEGSEVPRSIYSKVTWRF